MEHVERNLSEKNWKTPLNKDDKRQITSFLSLLGTGSFNIKQEKDNIRSYVAKLRSGLSDREVGDKSSQIATSLINLESFIHSKSIALYSPIKGEVSTQSIFDIALESEKEVYFPRVSGASLEFCRIWDPKQLKPGKFGVLEPNADLDKGEVGNIDLFVIPGLAFDKSGNRLGFGKGYYDRALASVSEIRKVGICYGFQIFDSLPVSENDKKVGTVVTEQGIVFSRRNLGGK